MPEGHTIHRIARDHRGWFAGEAIGLCSPQGRFEKESKRLDGNRLQDVTARGKHLFYHWSPQAIVHVHLELYGKPRVHRNPAPEPRGAVRVRMIGRIITVDCQLFDKPMSRLNSSERLNVYKRSNCRRCGTRIVTLLLGNRKMYGCETCQRMNQNS